jgi:hypothetical protein
VATEARMQPVSLQNMVIKWWNSELDSEDGWLQERKSISKNHYRNNDMKIASRSHELRKLIVSMKIKKTE